MKKSIVVIAVCLILGTAGGIGTYFALSNKNAYIKSYDGISKLSIKGYSVKKLNVSSEVTSFTVSNDDNFISFIKNQSYFIMEYENKKSADDTEKAYLLYNDNYYYELSLTEGEWWLSNKSTWASLSVHSYIFPFYGNHWISYICTSGEDVNKSIPLQECSVVSDFDSLAEYYSRIQNGDAKINYTDKEVYITGLSPYADKAKDGYLKLYIDGDNMMFDEITKDFYDGFSYQDK